MQKKALFVLLLLAACQPRIDSRGNVTVTEHIDEFVVGKTTMDDVISACGTPSLNKDGLTWYYIGAKSQEIAFQKVVMTDRYVVKMQFDRNRILRSIDKTPLPDTKILQADDEITDLVTDKRATEQAQQMIGSKSSCN